MQRETRRRREGRRQLGRRELSPGGGGRRGPAARRSRAVRRRKLGLEEALLRCLGREGCWRGEGRGRLGVGGRCQLVGGRRSGRRGRAAAAAARSSYLGRFPSGETAHQAGRAHTTRELSSILDHRPTPALYQPSLPHTHTISDGHLQPRLAAAQARVWRVAHLGRHRVANRPAVRRPRLAFLSVPRADTLLLLLARRSAPQPTASATSTRRRQRPRPSSTPAASRSGSRPRSRAIAASGSARAASAARRRGERRL